MKNFLIILGILLCLAAILDNPSFRKYKNANNKNVIVVNNSTNDVLKIIEISEDRGIINLEKVEVLQMCNKTIFVDGKQLVVPQKIKNLEIKITGNVGSVVLDTGKILVTGDITNSVTTTSGEVRCRDIFGDVNSISGNISCSSIFGKVTVFNGDVQIKK